MEAWQRIVCDRLQRLAHERGQRILIHGPPQYGKSIIVSQRLPSWLLGVNPTTRVRLACYNVTHAERFSKVNLSLMQSPDYQRLFPDAAARVPARASYEEWSTEARARLLDANPSFKPLGLGTGFTGMGADILIIDDPYKNRDEARSEAVNASLDGWWSDVVIPRMNPHTNVVIMFHRWWEGDFAGKRIAEGGWEQLRFPAIADGGPHDPTGRAIGEPLSPRYPLAYLADVKRKQGESFDALYQGTPTSAEGGLFKRGKVQLIHALPAGIKRRVRYWDIGASAGMGDYTVGLLMGEWNGHYYVIDVLRGQWSSEQRDAIIIETAKRDRNLYGSVPVLLPQDPGAAGKSMAEAFIRMLAGFSVSTVRESTDKVTRADPLSSQWNVGNVSVLQAPWTDAYLNELYAFDRGRYDDQVDASANAFNALASAPVVTAHRYDTR